VFFSAEILLIAGVTPVAQLVLNPDFEARPFPSS
jgi:hypothetical protein